MNIKYKDLSLIGKIYSLAELFYNGLKNGNNKYVEVVFSKLNSLKTEDINTPAALESSIENLIKNAKIQQQIIVGKMSNDVCYIYDGSIIETVWFDCIEFNNIKRKVKDDCLTQENLADLKSIFVEIHSFWVKDLKNKQLSTAERRDLYKIKEEIHSYLEKIEKRVNHNQITIM